MASGIQPNKFSKAKEGIEPGEKLCEEKLVVMGLRMVDVIVDYEKVFPRKCVFVVRRMAIKLFATCQGARDKGRVMGSTNVGKETLKVVTYTRKIVTNGLWVDVVAHENGEKT